MLIHIDIVAPVKPDRNVAAVRENADPCAYLNPITDAYAIAAVDDRVVPNPNPITEIDLRFVNENCRGTDARKATE
jgi:hypothetical protein